MPTTLGVSHCVKAHDMVNVPMMCIHMWHVDEMKCVTGCIGSALQLRFSLRLCMFCFQSNLKTTILKACPCASGLMHLLRGKAKDNKKRLSDLGWNSQAYGKDWSSLREPMLHLNSFQATRRVCWTLCPPDISCSKQHQCIPTSSREALLILRGPAAILFTSRDTCTDGIA